MQRWENYFLASNGDVSEFWKGYQHNKKRDFLFILGLGFDPRTLLGIQTVFSMKTNDKRDTMLLRYRKNISETALPNPKVKEHYDQLLGFLNESGFSVPIEKDILLRSDDDKNIASIRATFVIPDISAFNSYSDIIIDISAMPRGIFIPLINKCLALLDEYNSHNQTKKNLHIFVTENSLLDTFIQNNGIDESASYMHGFKIKEIESTAMQKQVWIPLLGENQTTQYDKIRQELNPVEICPVLPFPCDNLRRGDELIIEYQDRLMNDENVELRNIVYANESNPFQVYRLLYQTIQRYSDSFALLTGCKIIISVLSSKLLTLGAFMAAYDKIQEKCNLGIMHVESLGYELNAKYENEKMEIAKHNRFFEVWLAGDPYNEV